MSSIKYAGIFLIQQYPLEGFSIGKNTETSSFFSFFFFIGAKILVLKEFLF